MLKQIERFVLIQRIQFFIEHCEFKRFSDCNDHTFILVKYDLYHTCNYLVSLKCKTTHNTFILKELECKFRGRSHLQDILTQNSG